MLESFLSNFSWHLNLKQLWAFTPTITTGLYICLGEKNMILFYPHGDYGPKTTSYLRTPEYLIGFMVLGISGMYYKLTRHPIHVWPIYAMLIQSQSNHPTSGGPSNLTPIPPSSQLRIPPVISMRSTNNFESTYPFHPPKTAE